MDLEGRRESDNVILKWHKPRKQVLKEQREARRAQREETREFTKENPEANMSPLAVKGRVAKGMKKLVSLEDQISGQHKERVPVAPFKDTKQKAVVYKNGVPVPIKTNKIYHHNWNE